ncbi:hypothetical protein FB639_001740 [Coemansia asiatica]|nr:hypothetical protein FB639_001740 [Coemansia asiatica]
MIAICDDFDSGLGNRSDLFERVLFGSDTGTVDIEQLATLCMDGIPETADRWRATCWQLLLGYLPADRSQWDRTRIEARQTYFELVHSVAKQAEQDAAVATLMQTVAAQIRADIERTQPDISLFRQQISKDKRSNTMRTGTTINSASSSSSESTLFSDNEQAASAEHKQELCVCDSMLGQPQTHGDAMARVLLVYARFNRGAGYAQGMNEVLAPLYHVAEQQAQTAGDAEADAFHMLVRMLSGAHLDLFVAALDTPAGNGGLRGALHQWWTHRVRDADAELWERLAALGARPEHFAVRWLLVWGAREFALPDVLVLWDAAIASSAKQKPVLAVELAQARASKPVSAMAGRIACAVRVCCGVSGDAGDLEQLGFLYDFFTAVLLALRPRLMRSNFDTCLALLQGLRSADVPELCDMRALVASTVKLRQNRCKTRAVRACCAVLASADRRQQPSLRAPSTPTRLLRQITGRRTDSDSAAAVLLCVAPLSDDRLAVFEPISEDEAVMRLLGSCSAAVPSLASVAVGESMLVSVPRLRSTPLPSPLPSPSLFVPWWSDPASRLLSPVSPPCVCIDGSCCGMQGSLRVRRRIELNDADSDNDD